MAQLQRPQQSKIIKLFEIVRMLFVFSGIFMAYLKVPSASFYLLLLYVLPMTGLLAIEGIVFRKPSAIYKGRHPSIYQLQSAYFNLAICMVSVAVLVLHANEQAQVILIAIPTIFFFLSSLTHCYEFLHGGPKIDLWRFVGSVMLVIAIGIVLVWQQHY